MSNNLLGARPRGPSEEGIPEWATGETWVREREGAGLTPAFGHPSPSTADGEGPHAGGQAYAVRFVQRRHRSEKPSIQMSLTSKTTQSKIPNRRMAVRRTGRSASL